MLWRIGLVLETEVVWVNVFSPLWYDFSGFESVFVSVIILLQTYLVFFESPYENLG